MLMQRFLDGSDDLAMNDHFENIGDRSRQTFGAQADAALEFGHFRLLLRQRQLLADGVRIKLGTRGFDLLLALLEADGSLVTKDELFSRVWPGIVVSEENLKTQISALRKVLGEDRDFLLTEPGRGYRFTARIRRTGGPSSRRRPASRRRLSRRSVLHWGFRGPPHQAAACAGFGNYF
jgi:DNA-binding winged helix-turn-helix (wHTH) protein